MGNKWIKECLIHTATRKVHCKTEISNFQAISRASCCANQKIKSLVSPVSFSMVLGLNTGNKWWEMMCPTCHYPRTRRLWVAKLWVILPKTTTQQGYRRGRENKKPCDAKRIASNPRQSSPAQDTCSHPRQLLGGLAHCSSLPWKARLAGDNASRNREFEATLDILRMLGFTERVLRICQYSPLICHTHQWEGETGFRPHPALPLLKSLSWVRMSHCASAQSLVKKQTKNITACTALCQNKT